MVTGAVPVSESLRDAGMAGVGLLFPGCDQWRRGLYGRALSLGMIHLGAVVASLLCWGTVASPLAVLVAVLVHGISAAEALRVASSPHCQFARGVPRVSATLGLGLAIYLPTLGLCGSVAWPSTPAGREQEQYLINRWAYRGRLPGSGDWVCYEMSGASACDIGRVLAGPGQEVQWQGPSLTVDRVAVDPGIRLPRKGAGSLSLVVPAGHLLISPVSSPSGQAADVTLVPADRIVGQAWARSYPYQSRQILF